MKLDGKIAVVAGASGGIGREIAKSLAKEGVEVILVARNSEVLKAIKEDIEHKGGKAHVFRVDLTDRESVFRFVDGLKSKFSQVDILFHCTGIGVYKKFSDINLGDWESSFAANVSIPFLLTQSLLPLLKNSKKAYVIATGSGMGKIGIAERAAYCSSKFALRGLMLTLAQEFKNTNINFCLLTVGSVLTNFGPLTVKDKLTKQKKGKKYLDPEWLAHNIVAKLKHDTLITETSIYPRHYFEESKKGKT